MSSEDILKETFENQQSSQVGVDSFLDELGINDQIAAEEASKEEPVKDMIVPNPADQLADEDPLKPEVDRMYRDAEAKVAQDGWPKFIEESVTPFREKLYQNAGDLPPQVGATAMAADVAIGAAIDNVEQFGNFAIRSANAIEEWARENGITDKDFVKDDLTLDFANKLWPEPTGTTAGSVVRGISGYLLPLAGALKASKIVLKGGSALSKNTAAVGINAGLSAIKQDPEGKNISNLIQDHSELMAPIVGFLAIDDDDTAMTAAGKTAIESMIVDTMFLGAPSAIRGTAAGVKKGAKSAKPVTDKLAVAMSDHLMSVKKSFKTFGVNKKIDDALNIMSEGLEGGKQSAKQSLKKTVAGEVKEQSFKKVAPPKNYVLMSKPEDYVQVSKQNRKVFGDRLKSLMKKHPDAVERIAKGRTELLDDAFKIVNDGDPNKLFERVVKGQASESDIMAMEIMYEESMFDFADIIRKAYKSGAADDAMAVMEAAELVKTFGVMSKRVAGDAGAKLKLQQHGAQILSGADRRKAAEVTRHLMGKENVDDLIKNMNDLFDVPDDQLIKLGDRLVKKTVGQKIYDVVMELRTNSLLSGIGTQITSVQSATIRAPLNALERATAAKISKRQVSKNIDRGVEIARRNSERMGTKFDEASAREEMTRLYSQELIRPEEAGILMRDFLDSGTEAVLSGYGSVVDFLKLGHRGLKNQRVTEAQKSVGKFDADIATFKGAQGIRNKAITAENFGLKNDSFFGSSMNAFGSVIRVPSWFLSKGDAVTGMMHYRSQANAFAFREAKAIMGDLPAGAGAKDSAAYKAQLAKLQENFYAGDLDKMTPAHREIAKRVRSQAVEQSNQARFLNNVPDWAGKVNEVIYGAAPLRVLMPFSRVELNILSQTIDRTPLAPLTARYKQAIERGGAAAAEAQAKVAVGTSIGGIASMMAFSGALTGPSPKNRGRREMLKQSGWQEKSIRMPDGRYVSYEKLGEPFNKILSFGARMSDVAGYMYGEHSDEDVRNQYQDLGLLFGMAVAEMGTPEFLTEGFGDIIQALEEGGGAAAEHMLSDVAVSLAVPYSSMLRSIRKEVDPIKRSTDPENPNDPFTLLDRTLRKIENTIPGLSEDLPPQRNIFGEEQMYPAGVGPDMISPVYQTFPKHDPVVAELIRLGSVGPLTNPAAPKGEEYLQLGMPSKNYSVSVGGISNSFKMDPEQYDRMIVYMANNNDEMGVGMPLRDALEQAMINTTGESDQMRRIHIKKVYEQYKSLAKQMLTRDDDVIRDTIMRKNQEVLNSINHGPRAPDIFEGE